MAGAAERAYTVSTGWKQRKREERREGLGEGEQGRGEGKRERERLSFFCGLLRSQSPPPMIYLFQKVPPPKN